MLNQSKDTTRCPPDVSVDNQASLNPVLCTVALTKSSWEKNSGYCEPCNHYCGPDSIVYYRELLLLWLVYSRIGLSADCCILILVRVSWATGMVSDLQIYCHNNSKNYFWGLPSLD